MSNVSKKDKVRKRHRRIRKKIVGTKERPRLSLHRSNKHIYAQFIDDLEGSTIASCSTLSSDFSEKESTSSKTAAEKLGELAAKNAQEKGIKTVVFDRGGFQYHGRILAFADAARKGGLKF